MSPIVAFGTLIAHEGGWDEILLVGGPIVAIVALLAIAKRRVDAQPGAGDDPHGGPHGDD